MMAECATASLSTAAFESGTNLLPPPGVKSTENILIEEENLQEQRDEVLALQAIYEGTEEERIQVISEPNESGHGLFQMQITVPVLTPTECCQVKIMMPAPIDASPVEEDREMKLEASGGQIADGENQEKEAEKEEQGARAMTQTPGIHKRVALKRSLSGQRWTGSFKVNHLCPLTLQLTLPPTYPSQDPPAFSLSCAWLRRSQLTVLCRQMDKLWEANMNMPVIFSWLDWLENEMFSCLGLTDDLVLMPESTEEDGENPDSDGRVFSECSDLGQTIHTMLQYNKKKKTEIFRMNVQECSLCLDEKLGNHFFLMEPCQHHFCFDCMATHCNMHVSAGTIQQLTCPGYECTVMVAPYILQAVLSPEAFIRWETLSLQRSLDEMEDVVYCPRCLAVVIRESDATLNLGHCLNCFYSFCTECEQSWHQGTACQSDLDRLEMKASRAQAHDQRTRERYEAMRREVEQKMKSLTIIKSKTVPCPNCKIPVEKIEGCNKMTCRCGKHFCWLCGKQITGYSHFTEKSCVLFHYAPEPDPFVRRILYRRPPDAFLWMQARVDAIGNARDRQMRCVQCKQTNYKMEDNNNHIRCWNCKSNLCFHCKGRVTGALTQHFKFAGCPQHS